jgi:hypothetical protein
MKLLGYKTRPGAGFLLFVSVVVGAATFFVWGGATPRLERVWKLQIELENGDGDGLSKRERALLQDTLTRYPDLADAMLDGATMGLVSANDGGLVQGRYAYVVRRGPTPRAVLTVQPTRGERHNVRIQARTATRENDGRSDDDSAFTWELPDSGPFPQLVEIEMSGHDRRRVHSSARLSLEPLP